MNDNPQELWRMLQVAAVAFLPLVLNASHPPGRAALEDKPVVRLRAFGTAGGGGDTGEEGNVSMQHRLSIDDPHGRLKTYCAVEDYSHGGLRNIHIGDFGTPHGLAPTAPHCIVNGAARDSVDVDSLGPPGR